MQGCAALCRARSPNCAAFAFSATEAKCELSTGKPGTGACALSSAEGWVAFNLDDFKAPTPPVGACQEAVNACLNNGVCLSRTEQKDGSYVCACQVGFSGDRCQSTVAQPTWSSWSAYSTCSSTCGQGVRKRSRSCLDASGNPVNAVAACGPESPDVFEACNSSVCPSWSDWSEWSVCNTTTTCGPGVRQRSRSCANGGVVGTDCRGNAVESTPCNSVSCLLQNAPVSLNPVTYEPMTLGKGYVQIYSDVLATTGYVCSDGFDNAKEGLVVCRSLGFDGVQALPAASSLPPTPDQALYLLSKLECNGDEATLQSCAHSPWSNSTTCATGKAAYVLCKVNGRWSSWEGWESCEGKCGSAIRNRNRTCTNPRPLGGLGCDGDGFQEAVCPGLSPCPVDGTWTSWLPWQACSVLCGGGTRSRRRSCTPPQFGGADCVGLNSETDTCNSDPCPIDGYYLPWSDWAACSVTCNGGQQTRTRDCVPPANAGKPCVGAASETQACAQRGCPIDGAWSSWSAWSGCNATCGGGLSVRIRLCDNPAPVNDGSSCPGSGLDLLVCNAASCPAPAVNCQLSAWSAWSTCPVTCGGGSSRSRSRNVAIAAANGGLDCAASDKQEVEACGSGDCGVPGQWTDWGTWSPCSSTCGGGQRRRERSCIGQDPSRNMLPCPTNPTGSEMIATCHEFPCLPKRANCASWVRLGLQASAVVDIQPAVGVEAKAFCNTTDNSTTLSHSLQDNETLVQGFELPGSYQLKLKYSGGLAAGSALATAAIRCEQFMRLRCQNSLRTKAAATGEVMTWWNNRLGQKMTSWGSVPSNLTMCSCGYTKTCSQPIYLCNCDGPSADWVEDKGYVQDASALPVSSVQVGDTGNTGERVAVLVGPLVCWH